MAAGEKPSQDRVGGGAVRSTTLHVVSVLVVLALVVGANAQDCSWEWVNPAPPRVDIYRLKQEINAFVGVGAVGTIIRSSDGFRWELVESGVESDLYGIDWGAGFFVAVGRGSILRSTAGYDWTTVHVNGEAVFLDVEFSASRFVAVGDGLDGNFLTSRFGVDWELVPVPWGGSADSITGSDDGFFVAVGTEIWFSPDGFAWEYEGPVPAVPGFLDKTPPLKKIGSDLFELDRIDLAWTGSRLLWAGGSELWSREADGEWELVAVLDGCSFWRDWLGVVAGPGWALASGISGCPTPYLDPTVSLAISVDGGATFRDPWVTELGGFPALARYGSRWVAAGAYGDVLISSNSITWDCPSGNCTSLACADDFLDLAAGDDGWLAVGGVGLCDIGLKRRYGGTTATSDDGGQWAVHPQSVDRFRGVAYLGSEFIGVGNGWLGRSTDGIEWTTEDSPDDAVLYAVGVGDGWVVTVGRGGALYVSDDGSNWFKPFLYLSADLDRVVWDGEQFLVLGREGTIWRSTDAMNWWPAITATDTDLKGAVGGPGQRIAVGNDGVILASLDGEVWVPRRSGVDSSLHDVTWGDDRFVAVGWDERPDGSRPAVVLVSTDGRGWTRFSARGEALQRVRWTGTSWLVVGGDRTILTADCLGTLIEVDQQHLQVPHGETIDLEIRLSDPVSVDTLVSVSSSLPREVAVPQTVTILAGSDTAFIPVTGASVVAGAVLTVALPEHLGGGTTTALATVQPALWTPRTPSGRVRP